MLALKNKIFFVLNLTKFDTVINATTSNTEGNDLSPEMKTFYDRNLIKNAMPALVHDQFGQKRNIPQGRGKTIEFRKYSPFPKALTPLTEGVTPSGRALNVTTVTATVRQYGDFVCLTDLLILTAIDNNIVEATTLLGQQAGKTLDTVTREVLNGGDSVQYGDGSVSHRYHLDQTNDKMNLKCVQVAARFLKTQNAPKIDGSYVAIIHPDVAFDLMSEKDGWIDINKYTTSEKIFNGEIGKIAGVRFVETTEAKIFHAENLLGDTRNLTVKTAIESAGKVITIKETVSAAQAAALKGRKVLIGDAQYTIEDASASTENTDATITVDRNISTLDADTVIYPGEAGAAGCDVYSTLFLGANAFGTTSIEGGGLQTFIKQLGSGGTSDPLNQRATVGWKATKTAVRLVETFMLRVETACTYNGGAN